MVTTVHEARKNAKAADPPPLPIEIGLLQDSHQKLPLKIISCIQRKVALLHRISVITSRRESAGNAVSEILPVEQVIHRSAQQPRTLTMRKLHIHRGVGRHLLTEGIGLVVVEMLLTHINRIATQRGFFGYFP